MTTLDLHVGQSWQLLRALVDARGTKRGISKLVDDLKHLPCIGCLLVLSWVLAQTQTQGGERETREREREREKRDRERERERKRRERDERETRERRGRDERETRER